MKFPPAAFLILAMSCGTALAEDLAPYRLAKTITLGAAERWDYATFDADSGRVYVAHGDHVTVVDPSGDSNPDTRVQRASFAMKRSRTGGTRPFQRSTQKNNASSARSILHLTLHRLKPDALSWLVLQSANYGARVKVTIHADRRRHWAEESKSLNMRD